MNDQMKSSLTASCGPKGVITNVNPVGEAIIFSDSQFFPGRDGSWLMVDWMSTISTWYVTEGV